MNPFFFVNDLVLLLFSHCRRLNPVWYSRVMEVKRIDAGIGKANEELYELLVPLSQNSNLNIPLNL